MENFKLYKGNDLSNENYHAEKEHLSSSNLKDLLKDPEKFYDSKILGKERIISTGLQNAFSEGSLVHGLILEPHLVAEEFVQFPGMRKAGKDWEVFKAANKDRTILSKPQWVRCLGLEKAFLENNTATNLLKGCESELSLFGELEGVKIKVRADSINIEEGYIADIKTTSQPTDIDSFRFTCEDFGYKFSAALYCSLFEIYYGKPFTFYWVVLGKKDRSCEIYKMSNKSREEGDRKITQALRKYEKCKKTGIWIEPKVDILVKKCCDDYEILEV